ncbi:Lrp/AsnC family transcriptional regulator [Paucibacter sp. APW11]|uniref:siroheme decarboxylase n=1 Tax=Roseateles aquae TaxID=3077235 RepID=A0ABU3P646_9BURK|nr:Lrp/AsnC family transcriptional regulator [Paucibacter sp. APW11]MDT8998044.1 Lrp/AsnC family transcriptional regulator [Paucibacter sp. APW11]
MPSAMSVIDARLLNDWQQRFPLCERPFAALAESLKDNLAGAPPELLHCDATLVLQRLQALHEAGSLSRIGGIWNPGAGGAALLCAMAVPPQRLQAAAARVSAHPGVNHNYEREHAYNLWFVMTGVDAEAVERGVQALEQQSGLHVLRLPMQRAYRINLGFDLRSAGAVAHDAGEGRTRNVVRPVCAEDRGLAALLEQGLPLRERPYAVWAEALGWTEAQVLSRLQRWLDDGSLRRFGLIVRHHELGYRANAMCVFDVADELVDERAAALARQPGVTLCYRRARGPGWPYNLYCMMHGREREQVLQALGRAISAAGLDARSAAVLFSRRRFKQCGASYFRAHDAAPRQDGLAAQEAPHVLA